MEEEETTLTVFLGGNVIWVWEFELWKPFLPLSKTCLHMEKLWGDNLALHSGWPARSIRRAWKGAKLDFWSVERTDVWSRKGWWLVTGEANPLSTACTCFVKLLVTQRFCVVISRLFLSLSLSPPGVSSRYLYHGLQTSCYNSARWALAVCCSLGSFGKTIVRTVLLCGDFSVSRLSGTTKLAVKSRYNMLHKGGKEEDGALSSSNAAKMGIVTSPNLIHCCWCKRLSRLIKVKALRAGKSSLWMLDRTIIHMPVESLLFTLNLN